VNNQETLQFVRKSNGQTAQPGFIYINHWKTGHQELVFKTHEAAKRWANSTKANYTGPK
jgi:hypothetical protein